MSERAISVLAAAPDAPGVLTRATPDTLDFAHPERLPLVDPLAAYLDGLAPASRAAVRKRLRAAARVAGADPTAPPDTALPWGQLRAHHIAFIRARLIERGNAPATVNLTLAALRGIAREARNVNLMSDEEYRRIAEVKPHKGEMLPAGRSIRAGELTALVEACARDRTLAGARDAAILACLYVGGLRRAELAALDVGDYDPDPPTLKVRHGKGNKARLVPLEPSGAIALDAWLRVRGQVPGRLFLPVNHGGRIQGQGLTAQAIYNVLTKRAGQAKTEHASPHDLRRSFVGDLLDAGVDISTVQQLAGHANVTTTQRYDRRGEASKRTAVEKLHFPIPDIAKRHDTV